MNIYDVLEQNLRQGKLIDCLVCAVYNHVLQRNGHYEMDFSIFNVYESIILFGLLFTVAFL